MSTGTTVPWEAKRTTETRMVEDLLRKHFDQADSYRQNSASVRVRIIDPDLSEKTRRERNDLAWRYLDPLSEEAQGQISMLVLLTPSELARSMANLEFEDPVPSSL